MREHDLQAWANGPKAHDGTITTAAPDVMWGTDMTATVWARARPSSSWPSMDRVHRGQARDPITIGEGVARGLRLRHDHGSNYLADDFQQEVAFFGIESSPSFVREPEGASRNASSAR